MKRLPFFLQMEANECGLASLAMVAAYHGSGATLADLRRELPVSRKGVTVAGLVAMASALGLDTHPVRLDLEAVRHLRLPCILHWDLEHFVVLRSVGARGAVVHDPAVGVCRVPMREFARRFSGVAIECAPVRDIKRNTAPRPPRLSRWLGGVPGLRRSLAVIVGLTAVLELCAVLTPLLLQWVVDDVLPSRTTTLLTGLVVGFSLLVALELAIGLARGWLAATIGADVNLRWSGRTLAHLLRLPLSHFERRHDGDILASFTAVSTVQRTFTAGFIEAAVDGAMAFGTLGMMAWISGPGAALALGVALAYALACAALQRPLRHATAQQIVHEARQQSHLLETLRGMQAIRLYGRAAMRGSGWGRLVAQQANAELRLHGLKVAHGALRQFLTGLQHVVVVWFATRAVMDGATTLGQVFAFLAYLDQFTRRTMALLDRGLELMQLRPHLERVGDIVHTAPEPDDPAAPHAATTSTLPPTIQVRGLGYAYAYAEAPVLQSVDLDIRAGECVALVGPSGCGKTTLAKLLLGLLEPTAGEIRIDGVPLGAYGRGRLRARSGTVMQDDALFTGSIADNISLFDADADHAHVLHCAQLAALHDEIEAMPMGYGTLVGAQGTGLSGGQKQRLMLARALYQRPRLLVLDEATSHLDVLSEQRVNAAIRSLSLTRLVIAHRPETIAMADRVIRLAEGRVVDASPKAAGAARETPERLVAVAQGPVPVAQAELPSRS